MAQTVTSNSISESCNLTEEELWSGLDRQAADVLKHVAKCGVCQARAQGFRTGMEAVVSGSDLPVVPLPEQIGVYTIHRRLGEGGMGIVYEGEQRTPRRRVAVKVVRGGQFVDEYRLKLFQREVQTLARLRHPAIGAIYEAGRTDDGQHYFAMELVLGDRLNDFVRKHHVARRERLILFRKICDAIHYAHLRGVIHRDLKPSNILVDEEGNPKILDFGLARINDPDQPTGATATLAGHIMGTLPYMSPEEARGTYDEIDVRSDVYALGVILFELLTDQLPYTVSRSALHEAVRVICEEPPRRPGVIDRALYGDLETVVLKALEKERARRYQSAAALSEDIHRYLTDQPILARRANLWYRVRKFARRHQLVLLFTLLMLGLMVGSFLWVRREQDSMRESFRQLQDLRDIEVAHLRADLASKQIPENQDRALQLYRESLATFDRLGRFDPSAARIMVAMAAVMVDMENPDWAGAERVLVDAVRILRKGESHNDVLRALTLLLHVYGPDGLADPEASRATQEEIARLHDQRTGEESAPSENPHPADPNKL